MNKIIKEGKSLADLLEQIANEYEISQNEILYTTYEKKGGLFKGNIVVVEAITYNSLKDEIKSFLAELLNNLGFEVTLESKLRENQIIINMNSNNNPLLIGKNGQTLKALETIVRQYVLKDFRTCPIISLDVEDYKLKQQKRIERLAKNVAREVSRTKIEVALENMNSFERRLVHNILSNNKYVYTESVGEDPNRHVVIKPKNE
ncbi:MAG: KH domain-containing protein [Bacilli bacterium]|nr:KH domain-containing protein [Bacilli bacterium]